MGTSLLARAVDRARGATVTASAASVVQAEVVDSLPIPGDWPAAVVAASHIIGIRDDRTEARKLLERHAKWQDHAWDYFDSVPEVQNGVGFLGNALSKIIMYPALRAKPGDTPEATDHPAALDALSRLEGPLGGHRSILWGLGVHFSGPGECYLIGREVDDGAEERWEIRAKDEVKSSADGKIYLIDGGDSKDRVELGEDSMVVRMWNPHPRRARQATSSLRAVLAQCEELLILDRMARAIERSRNNAGILLVPNELRRVRRQVGTDASLQAEEGELADEMLEALGMPIKDEGHANAVVPHLLFGEEQYLDKVKMLELHRALDEWMDVRTVRVQKRFAAGFNLPIELTTGAEGLNHWTKASVDEEGFKSYVLPLVLLGLESLTSGYYHPMLRAAGVPEWRDHIIWYDSSQLVVRTNAFDQATALHEAGAIRDEDYRRAGGYGEDAAPDEAEIQRRILWKSAGRTNSGPQDVSAPTPSPEPEGGAAITAAGEPELARLARRQADLDRQLYARLEAAFEAAIDKVLELAGTRVVQRTKGKSASRVAAAATVKDVPFRKAAKALGRSVVAQLGLAEDELLRGAFDDLKGRFRAYIGQAQVAALSLVPGLTDDERDSAGQEFERLLDESWAWTRQALTDLARERLYDPDPRNDSEGEQDATATVPFAIVREAVARAGGAIGPDAPVAAAGFLDRTRTALGLATGWLIGRLLGNHGIVTEGWEWEYGAYPRTAEFEPHADLDGTVFLSFQADVLANGEGWPSYQHYFPGDHEGCFVAGTEALAPGLLGSTERTYTGDFVQVVTASGKHLTVTPNHPILTDKGWVAAGLLDKGDHVVRCGDPQRVALVVDPDHAQDPAPIEQIARSLGEASGVVAASVKAAPEHFHGDGVGSDVYVVRSRRLLGNEVDPVPDEVAEIPFEGGDTDASFLPSLRSAGELFIGVGATSLRSVSGSGIRLPLLGGHSTHSDEGSFVTPPDGDSGADQMATNRRPLSTVGAGKGQLGLASKVSLGEFSNGQDVGGVLRTLRDASLLEDALKAGALDMAGASGVSKGLAGYVELDRVVDISRTSGTRQVFNLHTASNWYLAETIVVHNCKCTAIPRLVRG